MRTFFRKMNPTVRGFLIIAAVVLIVMVLNLYGTLFALGILLRIAFFLAIAFFVYLMWRERREEISGWDARERVVFYGSALLIVAALGSYFWQGLPGYDALGIIGVIACAGFAMFRVWRDRHTYT
jgi:membrane protease YdiL (CAAX protease family)